MPELVRAIRPRTDLKAYRSLRSAIRRLKPDVVHTHSSKAGILGRAAAWNEGVPAVVHTIHGMPFGLLRARRRTDFTSRWNAGRPGAVMPSSAFATP